MSSILNTIELDERRLTDSDSSISTISDSDGPRNTPEHIPNACTIPSFKCRGFTLRAGKCVELIDEDFLLISQILRNVQNQIYIQGHRYRRNIFLQVFERKKNEITRLIGSIETVSVDYVLCVRKLTHTNLPWPRLSFTETATRQDKAMGSQWQYAHGTLICRCSADLRHKEGNIYVMSAQEVQRLNGHFVEEHDLRVMFRGEKARAEHANKSYTFGDTFCGCGGASRGAEMAGLEVAWGVDLNIHAHQTYAANFPSADSWHADAYSIGHEIQDNLQVDVLHLSPPCQTFAPCHTRPGPMDDSNEAAFLSIEHIIRKVKPRIMTLEETFGLLGTERKRQWFYAIIRILTKLGFSIRWRVLNLSEFGLPQPRKRPILFASCPGEPLPEFPSRTHGPPPLRPFTTINQLLSTIPRTASHHTPANLPVIDKTPYDGDRLLSRTITCGDGQGHHPDGKRAFTLREIASFQGFPHYHHLGTTATRKMIGNAFPPSVAKEFLAQVKRSLQLYDE